MTITNSDYFPTALTHFSSSGYEGDTSERISVFTTGEIKVHEPVNASSSGYYAVINGFYRFA